MTYKGYTLEEIKSMLDYDPDSGIFKSKISGKVLIDRTFSTRHPVTRIADKLYLSRVAVMIGRDDYLKEGDRVTFKDGDPYNNKLDNLVVVSFKEIYKNKANNPTNTYLETEYEHVYVGSLNRLFVVRRNSNQGIYRTYDKEEAVAVRDRWIESGKVLHEWDNFTPKWYKTMLENNEYLHILKENEEKSDFC
jgi:signal peptidase I